MVLQSKRPLTLSNVPESKSFNTHLSKKIRTWLGVPLLIRDQVIGMISIDSSRPDYFTPDQVQIASAFADQVAIAIENARLYRQVQFEKSFFETVVSTTPIAIIVTNRDDVVTSWNPEAERIFGFNQSEAIGQNIDSLVANEENIYLDALRYSETMRRRNLSTPLCSALAKTGLCLMWKCLSSRLS